MNILRPCTEQLCVILDDVQQSVDNHCKHGVFLCECLDDCPDCFEEALSEYRGEPGELVQEHELPFDYPGYVLGVVNSHRTGLGDDR